MKNVGHPRPTAYLMAPYVESCNVHQGEKTSCNVEGEKTGQMGRICIHDCSQRAPRVHTALALMDIRDMFFMHNDG